MIVNLVPAALLVLGVLALWKFSGAVRGPLLALTLAGVLAAAINPVVVWAHTRLHLRRPVAAGLTLLLVIGVLLGTFLLIVPTLAEQVRAFGLALPGTFQLLGGRLSELSERYPSLLPFVRENVIGDLGQRVSGLLSGIVTVASSLINVVALGVVAVIVVLYTLARPEPLIQGLLSLFPRAQRARAATVTGRILRQLGAWGRSEVVLMLVVGATMALGLWVLGVDNWLLFGVISALGELVPTLGPILAAVPPILVTLAVDPQLAVWVAVFAVVVQQLEGNVLSPLILGSASDMHPVSVTVGVLLFSQVLGLLGALLTVPFLIVIKAVYEGFYVAREGEVPEAAAGRVANAPGIPAEGASGEGP